MTIEPDSPDATADLIGPPARFELGAAWLVIGAMTILALWGTYAAYLPAPALAVADSADLPRVARLGAPAPSFSIPPVASESRLQLGDVRGKPVLLNFWATWCPPCRTEMPEFQRFHTQSANGASVFGINIREDPATVSAFLDQYGITYLVGLDLDGGVSAAYGVTGLPTTVFVDSAGVVRDRVVGPLTYDGLDQRTKRLP